MEEEVSAMTEILTAAGEIFTQTVTWAGETVTFVTGEPLMLIPAILGVAFLGVSLYRRLAG